MKIGILDDIFKAVRVKLTCRSAHSDHVESETSNLIIYTRGQQNYKAEPYHFLILQLCEYCLVASLWGEARKVYIYVQYEICHKTSPLEALLEMYLYERTVEPIKIVTHTYQDTSPGCWERQWLCDFRRLARWPCRAISPYLRYMYTCTHSSTPYGMRGTQKTLR